MPTNMPGGKIISGMGGYLNAISPYDGNMTRLDVASYSIYRKIKMFAKGHSGSIGGAILRRQVAFDWTAQLKVWWDIGNPPTEVLNNQGWGCGIQFGLGSRAGQAQYGVTPQQFYLAPSAIMGDVEIIDSSEGNDDDVVTANVEIGGNASIFLMPNQTADYQVWEILAQNLGQFNGLPSFSVMQ